MPDPLIDPAPSDAGGIAARRGFRFQDHVAARLALEMLQDPDIAQLECETADDIILRREHRGVAVNEYIQVKTTEIDSKWNITELTAREKARKGSSVCERSLLSDQFGGTAWFRFVTTRGVSTRLVPFLRPRHERPGFPAADALVDSFRKRYRDVKSGSGLGLGDWAERMLWEVEGDERSLLARNVNEMLRLAATRGPTPAYQLMTDTYGALVDMVRALADASTSTPSEKVCTRTELIGWWEGRLRRMRDTASSTVKVYQIATRSPFFSELARVDETAIKKALYAFDVEYDGGLWRRSELIDHLLDWLPEMTLPASTLAGINHVTARQLPAQTLKALDRRGVTDMPQVVAAVMLHAILRHHFDAEPIACRIFFQVAGGARATSAHIVRTGDVEEVWLGRSKLITAATHRGVVDEVLEEMRSALSRDVLVEEREIIVQLREPHHLRADNLGPVLNAMAKTSDLLDVLRLPVLIAYDSATLSSGFAPDYVEHLRTEVEAEYARIKCQLGHELDRVEIAIFLVPVECADTLALDFEKRLRRA